MRIKRDTPWEGREGDGPRNGEGAWGQQPSEAISTPGPEEAGDRAGSPGHLF